MTGSIQVLVRDKETQQTAVLTYKAFRDTSYRFDLIGQVDDNGNLMESDPNLLPQHQRKVAVKSPAVADVGTFTQGSPTQTPERTGPDIELTLGHVVRDFPADTFPVEHPTELSTSDPDNFTITTEAAPDSVQEPIKTRKKPGPKPKNKEI